MIKTHNSVNFRQHTDLALSFDQGVTVPRGANEAGKSTVFEATSTHCSAPVPPVQRTDHLGAARRQTSSGANPSKSAGEYTIAVTPNPPSSITMVGALPSRPARFCEQLLDLKSGMGTS